jgi:hypothetical protein
MLPAKIYEFSAISNFCSTVIHRACLLRSPQQALYAPFKDRPMSLPTLAELPAVLLPFAIRAEQSFRDAVAALDDDHGLSEWTPQRWADFARGVRGQ